MSQIVSFDDYKPPARFDDTPWTDARIEEAAAATGPWTVIDLIALTPADTDTAHPVLRSFTTDQGSGPGLWYQVVFLDAGLAESNPTTPVRNSDAGPPARFATADDFAERLGLTLSDEEEARADVLLELASGLIQDEAGQTITLVTDDVLTMPGTSDDRIKLPQRPVVSVASVTLGATELVEGSAWFLDGSEIVRLGSSFSRSLGLLDDFTPGFGRSNQTVTIVYTHGFDPVPETVKSICMEMVVRVWVNPGAVAQEKVGDVSTLYHYAPDSPGLLLSIAERRIIRRLFGRSAKSITVGG